MPNRRQTVDCDPAYNALVKYLRVILIVLLLVCCTLWVASYWNITWMSSNNRLVLQLWDGRFGIAILEPGWTYYDDPYIDGLQNVDMAWWPIVWVYSELEEWVIRGTFWLPTLLLGFSTAIFLIPWARRRRRAKQGLCIRCGYDLSGSESGGCSECGTEMVRA